MVLSAKQALDRFLLRVVDGSLAGVIFLVPLLMGGRHALGQLVLTVLAVAAAWAWSARRWLECSSDECSRRTPGAESARGACGAQWLPPVLLLLFGTALLLVQIAPLPAWLLARLAPHTAEVLPLWRGGGGDSAWPGPWSCVSLAPAETLASLVIFLDYGLLFLVALQRVRGVEDVERLLRWCALSAVIMATFGIVQLLAGNGKFFWFYEHPLADTSGVAKGSFSNRNHFAQFLALGIGPLVWWLQDALRRKCSPHTPCAERAGVSARSWGGPHTECADYNLTAYLLGLSLAIVLFAGLLSLSRGGIAAMALAATVSTAVCWRTAALGGRLLAALAAAGVVIGVSLAIFGLDRVGNRLEDYSSGSLDRLDQSAGRRTIWAATVKAIPDFLPLGAGAGSFCDVYPTYSNLFSDDDKDATHAENGPLQVALETGLVGAALLLAGIALCGWWCIGGLRRGVPGRLRVCAGAIAASLAASLAHSLVDFVWYVPACTAIVALLAACALRTWQLGREAREEGAAVPAAAKHPSSLAPLAAVLLLTGLGAWMIGNRIGPALAQPYFDQFMVQYRAAKGQAPETFGGDPVDQQTLRQWISCLENVVRWEPTHVVAHLRLTEIHERLFEKLQMAGVNQMPLRHVADAAIQQRFPTREALVAWLAAAVGPHWEHLDRAGRHARQAVALCPLRGRAYLALAELSFLCGDRGASGRACIEQALRVRPLDGVVLLAASQDASLAGDHRRAMEYAKLAFQSGPRQRRQVIASFVASTPTEGLPALIDAIVADFKPDLEALRFLHGACAARSAPEQLSPLLRCWAKKAEAEAQRPGNGQSASVWLEAHQLHSRLGNGGDALRCARNALQCDPGNYEVRRQLGLCLIRQGLFTEAESHLRWCLGRTPDNQAIAAAIRAALKGRLDAEARTADQNGRLR